MTKTTIILLAVALYPANVAHSTTTRPTQRQIDSIAEAEHGHRSGLLAAHRRYERAQRRCYSRKFNGGKSQVCGPHQILIWDKTTRDGQRLGALVKGRLGGAWAASLLLKLSRERFNKKCGKERNLDCVCPGQWLNFGDRTRLCKRLIGEEK